MITQEWLTELTQAAQDSMQDDFPTVRHEGRARMQRMLTPVAVLQLIEQLKQNTTP